MLVRFDEAFIQEVREKNDIVGLVSEYVHLTRRGKDYWGLCPFHAEKSPSFHVVPEKGFYHCFGCKATGDVFRFLMEKDHLTFYEAVEHLARRAKIPLPRAEMTPAQEQAAQERQQVYKALEFAARFFEHQLLHQPAGRAAREYLQRRGLTDEVIARFRLGYAPDRWDALWRSARQRFAPEILVKAGLVMAREQGGGYYDRFRNRVMFPIADLRGRVVGFGGRALAPDQNPKYYNSPDGPFFNKRYHLYGLHAAKETMRARDEGIIVEGYMDVIALHQAGFPFAVASLGTALTREQAELLRRQCSRVIIAYDADVAGQAATLRGFDILAEAGLDLKVLQLPEGKDPDELIRAGGPEAFNAALGQALPLIEFKIRSALEKHRGAGNAPEVRAAVMREVVPILAAIRDPVLQEQYTKRAAMWMAENVVVRWGEEVSEESLRHMVKAHLENIAKRGYDTHISSKTWHNRKVMAGQDSRPGGAERTLRGSPPRPSYRPTGGYGETAPARPLPPTPPLRAADIDPVREAERTVLRVLVHRPELLQRANALQEYAWQVPEHQNIYQSLVRVAGSGAGLSGGVAAQLLAAVDSAGARALVAELEEQAQVIVQPERELKDALDRLVQDRNQRRIRELQAIFREREAAGQQVEPALLLEYQELIRRTRL